MEPDYPAAHSMDTTWFAVDRDGHIGIFESGESGAVPENAADLSIDELLEHLRPGGWAYHPAQSQAPGVPQTQHRAGHFTRGPLDTVLMFLVDLGPVEADLRSGSAREVPATKGVAVLWSRLTEERYDALHASGACRHCRHDYSRYQEGDEELVGSRGSLFCFEHLTDNWSAGPYAVETQPERPLNVSELPPDLRSAVSQVRFDRSFGESPLLQPVEHFECISWGGAWLPADGSEARPIPGREDDYEIQYVDWLTSPDDDDDYEMAPPPGWTPEKTEQALARRNAANTPRPASGGGVLGFLRRLFGG
jgi:hypothetical protein